MEHNMRQIKELWYVCFNDDIVPNDDGCKELMNAAGGDYGIVEKAICICSDNESVSSRSFDAKFSYTKGIIRNLRNNRLSEKWNG